MFFKKLLTGFIATFFISSAINAADLDITATLEDSNTTLKLVNTFAYDIELKNVQVPTITKAQDTPTSFFSFQPIDASGNSLGNSQTVYDFDQTIASRLDEMVVIQNHLANQRAKVGSRINSGERQRDVMEEREIQINKDVSDLADADLSALVTQLQSQITNQEASQKAFVRIAQLNLFDSICLKYRKNIQPIVINNAILDPQIILLAAKVITHHRVNNTIPALILIEL